MPYTRPDFNAAHATWAGAAAYTRPTYNAANATFFVSSGPTTDVWVSDTGLPADPAVYVVFPRDAYIKDDAGILGEPAVFASFSTVAWAVTASMLGAVEILAAQNWVAWIEDSGLPAAITALAYTDPTPYIDPIAPVRYSMELVASDGSSIRVPISSWQGTLQTVEQCYLSCNVPACEDYLDALNDATEFVIWRVARLRAGGTVESLVARAPLDTLTLNQGPTAYSASLSGYFDAYPTITDPDARYDRELSGVQTMSVYPSGLRVRASFDWLLQPGQRATWGSTEFIVSYINYYANGTFDYMDLGVRT